MTRHFVFLLCLAVLSSPVFSAPLQNRLAGHASPYLAQHANDPVAWQVWDAGVMARARREGKVVFVSVGYSACHWCHVMQRESYRNPEIAALLNRHFIPVKVDRELDPALDAQLIRFAERTRGMSGWPLNVFLTPEGHPFYAGLYFPPAEFLGVLKRIETLWRTDRASLSQLAAREAAPPTAARLPVDAASAGRHAARLVSGALAVADPMHGGFGEQSKFPNAPVLHALLDENARRADPKLRTFLIQTLDQMASQGLRDHVGGGFFRYTTDPSWKTPHFEKMLYDNAQLARLYLRAAVLLDRPDYRAIAFETLDFLASTMRDPSGLFIASLSALDDRGVEGGYYLWTREQLKAVLSPEERAVFALAAGAEDAAPFEAGYLPLRAMTVEQVAARLSLDQTIIQSRLSAAYAKLRAARGQRTLPRDNKLIAAWNGLMLSALVEAAQAPGGERFRPLAVSLQQALATRLWNGRQLARAWAGQGAAGSASVEDYAYVAAAFEEYARWSTRPEHSALARAVLASAWRRFHDASGWRLEEQSLLADARREAWLEDGPMPSPSGLLIRLAAHGADESLRVQAKEALARGGSVVRETFAHATTIETLRRVTAAR